MADVAANFSNMFNGKTSCRLGCDAVEDYSHVINCEEFSGKASLHDGDERFIFDNNINKLNEVSNQLINIINQRAEQYKSLVDQEDN